MSSELVSQPQPFDVLEWRRGVQIEIRDLAKDLFGCMQESKVRSLFHYLVLATLRPAIHRYQQDAQACEHIVTTIQAIAGVFAQPLVDALQTEQYLDGTLASVLEGQLNSPEMCRAVEQIMSQVNTLPLVQNVFAGDEWLLRVLAHELQQWHAKGHFQHLILSLSSDQYTAAPVSRGALKLEVSVSKPIIVAGEEFSLFVVIRNPYQVPVVLYTVQTHLPVELVDMIDLRSRHRELAKQTASRLEQIKATSWRRALVGSWFAWRNQRQLKREPGTRLAEAVGTDYKPELITPEPKLSLQVSQQVQTVSGGSVTGAEIHNIERMAQFLLDFPEQPTPEYLDRIMWRIEEYKSGRVPVLLQPGDSVVKQFVFRTRRWLLFTPLIHSFQIQVRYTVDGRDHLDTVRYDLSIQATINATLTGAVLGGTLGGVARILVDSSSPAGTANAPAQVGSLLLAVILSAVSVVSLARKSNVQQIISIEDFWGGLFLGFLIGYLGQNFALGILSPQAPTTQ